MLFYVAANDLHRVHDQQLGINYSSSRVCVVSLFVPLFVFHLFCSLLFCSLLLAYGQFFFYMRSGFGTL